MPSAKHRAHRPRDLERMAGYEILRLRTAKTIWAALGLSVFSAMAAGGTLALGKDQSLGDASSARMLWIDVLTSPVSVTAIIAGVAGAAIAGQEMRWGTLVDIFIRLSHRWIFVFVKASAAALLGGIMCLSAVLSGWLIVRLTGGTYASRLSAEAALSISGQSQLLMRVFVVGMFCALMSLSVTFVTGSLVAGISVPVVWANVLEPLLAVLGGRGSILVHFLPYQNMRSFVSASDAYATGITTSSASLVMLGSVLLFGILGARRLISYEP